MGYLLKIIERFCSNRFMLFLNFIFLFLAILSILYGLRIGFFNEIFRYPLFRYSEGYVGYLPLKPATLFLYSLLGFGLTLLLILRKQILNLSSDARISIATLILIPEAINFYEFFNQYAFWVITRSSIENPYFIFTTKAAGAVIFFLIGFQILLLKEK